MATRFLFGLAFALIGGNAAAIDTSEPFLCASMQVHECIDGRDCQAVLPEEVSAPTFLRVNVAKKEIKVFRDAPPSKIVSVSEIENRLILQGAEEADETRPDGAGWTLSIEQETGRFVAAAAVLQGAIVIFGACTEI
ncbi:MAG: hypothetical protein QNJ73_14785 [Gammaproteobacteria bacterium]|nr:hypothetical protein [Gammaproteobacteria bacterium]